MIDGRQYTCRLAPTAFTTTVDLFEVTPADDKPIVILGCVIFQTGTADFGDAQEEGLEINIQRGGTAMTSGSGGSAAAAGVPTDASGATAGFTFEAGNTTLATFTGGTIPWEDAMNVRVGWQYWPIPEARISCSQANGGIVVRVAAAPADSITLNGSLVVAELG